MSRRWRGFAHAWGQINLPILAVVVLLALAGIGMMVSAGGGSLSPWADRQMVRCGLGFVVMLTIATVPANFWLRHAYLIYAAGIVMLLVVEGMGYLGKGAQRWVDVGGVNLQPSEAMKLCLILALARFFHTAPPGSAMRWPRLLAALGIIGLPAALILHQPNLGTATILTLVGVSLIFVMGLSWRIIIIVAVLGLAALPLGWNFLHDYQKQRVMTFLHPEQDPLGAGYNIMQSMIAIGSGGVAGKGYLQGSQGQLDFLPEKHTDFIFTMVAEEFGFIGSVCLLGIFLALILLSVAVAARAKSVFCSLVAMGIGAMIFVHVAINTAMVMGLIPVVGVPLPLISYGGSIELATLAGCGLLLNAFASRDEMLRRSTL